MKKSLVAGLILAMFSFASTVTADACSRTTVTGANQVIRPGKSTNSALLDAAVRVEVNYHRCRAGLAPVRSKARLIRVAQEHSNWMARARNMTHKSTAPGRRTLGDRMKRSGIRYRAAAENIGFVYRFPLERRKFFVNNAASCQFTNSAGQAIVAHSYQSLARYIVGLWMASSGHRHNILNRRMKMVGTAIALDTKAKFCGQYYITQNFAQQL